MRKFLFLVAVIVFLLIPNVFALRDRQPIVISGGELPGLMGRPVDQIWLYSYNSSGFSQIRFQVDEKSDTYNKTLTLQPYVWSGTEGNGFDANDELVLMAEDLGQKETSLQQWIPNTEDQRIEIEFTDTLDGSQSYAYIFFSSSLSREFPDQVSYTPRSSSTALVETSFYKIKHGGNWYWTELAIKPPLGDGQDLIDRTKGRAFDLVNGETEETWSEFSRYQGDIDGPLRAIRLINGAASAVPNTSFYTFFYPAYIKKHIYLLVHPVGFVTVYTDYNSTRLPLNYYDKNNQQKVLINGVPETINKTNETPIFNSWALVNSSVGSIITILDSVVLNPQINVTHQWIDDSGFYDSTGDDIGVYGAVGFEWRGPGVGEGYFNETLYMLSSTASVEDAKRYRMYESNPLQLSSGLQTKAGQCTDNDGDGYGPGCSAGPDCNDNNPLVQSMISCNYNGTSCGAYSLCQQTCPTPPSEICNNNIDDDCNNLIDCSDSLCSSDSSCTGIPTCRNQNGDVCTQPDTCPGSLLNASDTNFCCSQQCADNNQGDITDDFIVNVFDLTFVGSRFGLTPGQTRWDEKADDCTEDNTIDVQDLDCVSENFGKRY